MVSYSLKVCEDLLQFCLCMFEEEGRYLLKCWIVWGLYLSFYPWFLTLFVLENSLEFCRSCCDVVSVHSKMKLKTLHGNSRTISTPNFHQDKNRRGYAKRKKPKTQGSLLKGPETTGVFFVGAKMRSWINFFVSVLLFHHSLEAFLEGLEVKYLFDIRGVVFFGSSFVLCFIWMEKICNIFFLLFHRTPWLHLENSQLI